MRPGGSIPPASAGGGSPAPTSAARTRSGEEALDNYDEEETPPEAVDRALRYWAEPGVTPGTQAELLQFAQAAEEAIEADWQESAYRALRQNALRMLIANSPDMQAS